MSPTMKLIVVCQSEYILKTGDILYVSIKSMNPEVNLLYNPESNMETSYGTGVYEVYDSQWSLSLWI